jgi:hypothetical protein
LGPSDIISFDEFAKKSRKNDKFGEKEYEFRFDFFFHIN